MYLPPRKSKWPPYLQKGLFVEGSKYLLLVDELVNSRNLFCLFVINKVRRKLLFAFPPTFLSHFCLVLITRDRYVPNVLTLLQFWDMIRFSTTGNW